MTDLETISMHPASTDKRIQKCLHENLRERGGMLRSFKKHQEYSISLRQNSGRTYLLHPRQTIKQEIR